jgi:hypothetical protein
MICLRAWAMKESACSIAAINLALSGKLTDNIPDCMSDVLGKATIRLQDAMPEEMRNSERYKALLPEMAGTGREHEQERLAILMDWMWSVVLPQLQPIAESKGFGDAWQNMCNLKTYAAAADAAAAARAADYAAADAAVLLLLVLLLLLMLIMLIAAAAAAPVLLLCCC